MKRKQSSMALGSLSDNPKSAIQNPKWVGIVAISVILAMCGAVAQAQQPAKVPRIGYLSPGPAPTPSGLEPRLEALRQYLRELGHIEGQNIAIEYRWAEGKLDRLPGLAAELVHLKVDVIVSMGAATVPTAKSVKTIPVVIGYSGDPVEAGVVASLARPGGNVTGVTFFAAELAGKRVELLKEAAARISRLAVLANPGHPGEQRELRETQAAAQALAMTLQYLAARLPNDFNEAFRAMTREGAHAVVTFPDAVTSAQRKQIADFALKSRLPSVFGWREYVEAGGLMSYGPNRDDSYRRIATHIDKILKGAKPADLPVEQPMKFELVINLKTAKQIGLTIPQSVLFRADKVIR
ncbi:MAG: ABC transporter substrate-binding protein [Deltaproteobacteria bacterium]|nr:ABC transporter substrate-binding protein [Deltaproteobacteria bacterium]